MPSMYCQTSRKIPTNFLLSIFKGKKVILMDLSLIAPCGMNCGICTAHLRDKKKCPGCNGNDVNKSASCINCKIKNCEKRQESNWELCYECDTFPCTRMKQLDKRYRTKYAMSMIENLEQIENLGMDEFFQNEETRWTCKNCGGIICVHGGYCSRCNEKK